MAKTNGISMDQDWQAESDVRTLIEAEAIRKDKKRFAAATKMARKKAEQMEAAFKTESETNDDD